MPGRQGIDDSGGEASVAPVVLGHGLGAYLRLLGHGPALRPFAAAFVARLPTSMAPLGMLVLVQQARGAYSIAGVVTGAFALGSAAGTPLWGRLMDRFGQIRVLVPTSVVGAALLGALALTTVTAAPTAVLLTLATLAGLSYPPMSPALRSAWRVIFPSPAERRVAFALDGTSVELIFVGGPLLLSLLLALAGPVVPLLVTAGLMVTGGLAYCRTAAARLSGPGRTGARKGSDGPASGSGSAVTASGVAALLLVMLALSVGFGQLDTSLTAAAGLLLGGTSYVGVLFAAIAGGSAAGGLLYGARAWRFDERQAVPVLLTTFGVLLTLMALLMSLPAVRLWVVLGLLVVTGATIAPVLIMQQGLLDQLTPAGQLNEAQAFLSASNTTGAALGTALAGLLIDYSGLVWSFGGAALFIAGAASVAAFSQNRWRSAIAALPGARHESASG